MKKSQVKYFFRHHPATAGRRPGTFASISSLNNQRKLEFDQEKSMLGMNLTVPEGSTSRASQKQKQADSAMAFEIALQQQKPLNFLQGCGILPAIWALGAQAHICQHVWDCGRVCGIGRWDRARSGLVYCFCNSRIETQDLRYNSSMMEYIIYTNLFCQVLVIQWTSEINE